jgi:predicted acylesterase/phospholipase RssA
VKISRVSRRTARAALLVLAAASCSTLDVVRVYNNGSHGTIGDPGVTPVDGATRLLGHMIVDQMSGAYFQDGEALAPWFEHASAAFPGLVKQPFEPVEPLEPDAGPVEHERRVARFKGSGTHGRYDEVETLVRKKSSSAPWMAAPQLPLSAYCENKTLSAKGKVFADALRFYVSLVRAVQTAKAWQGEGLIDDVSLDKGTQSGFGEVAEYMKHRRFHRDAGRPNIGIVVSGGASNGMFSAGAVWTLLNMIDGCLSSRDRCKVDPRFRLISGTSAGSMVATVVGMFNAEWEDGHGNLKATVQAGQPVLNKLAQWFTCLPAQQLYCVDKDTTLSIFSNRVGLVDFDGARWLLGKNVKQGVLDDTSELFLNTVDFQSGAVLTPSDQNPADTRGTCDVVQHALSSIPEPFVANPIREDAGAGKPPRGFFLDGGVRSVVPLMPLVRHGADKVVIVSSSPSAVEGATPPVQAIDILERFIDITIGTNGEEGIALAEAFAELQAAREEKLCRRILNCPPADEMCNKLCGGALREACDGQPARPRAEDFPVVALYRNEARVPPAAGYSFDPRQSLPLFLAGMAAVRERCAEFASFLGDLPLADAQKWCNRPLPTAATCEDPQVQWPLKQYKYSTKEPTKNPPETIRSCDPTIWKDDPPACP